MAVAGEGAPDLVMAVGITSGLMLLHLLDLFDHTRVCVLHIKQLFLPVNNQHNQCPCR